mgnify:CR=1 FL=1|tara:strand:- start:994 stop:2136 length:1143 start_codon:yes stop_codon:yes gene_type:complete
MPHLLQEYAKNLGVKISEPIFKGHFFPLNFDKYIVLYNEDNIQSRNYKYFNIVLSVLRPFFNKYNIKIVQFGLNKNIEGVNKVLNLPLKQQSYLISKSMLYVGCDGILSQIADFEKIPSVNLYGNVYANACKPLIGDSSKAINIEPDWDKNPSFSLDDPASQINRIKPEVIAQSIIDLLKIEKAKVNFKTLQIGSAFGSPAIEIIPTTFHRIQTRPDEKIFLRTDYGFEPKVFEQYCQNYKVSIFSDKAINISQIQPYINNIKNIFIFIDENSDQISQDYFDSLSELNIKHTLLVKDEKLLPKVRNKYFDINIQTFNSDSKKRCEVNPKCKFFTKKTIFKDGKLYTSLAHLKNNLDNNDLVIDSDDFWKESQQFFIYEQN